ncbi:unnamed protein product [Leptosia nina]|uniref:Reverse transcriptase domain-containing protein n=1 Tax=Leptosia nina TaxID=320188 RepID=A0AAV1JV43_9NEOP
MRKIKSLDILYQNVRGLKTKLTSWRNSIAALDNHLIAVTESFLDGSVEDQELICVGWSVLRRDRKTPCGGVLIAARAPILLKHCKELQTDAGEDLWASFVWLGRKIFVCVVYIKPSAGDSEYMAWFCKVESFIHSLKAFTVIILEHNTVPNCHGRFLDVILTRESDEVRGITVMGTAGLVPPDFYHPPLNIEILFNFVRHSDSIAPSNIDSAKDWNFKKCDFQQLQRYLSQASWTNVLQASDVDKACEHFYSTLYDIFDLCVPKKHRRSKCHRYPVWFTNDIIRDLRRKVKLHASWKRLKSNEAYIVFSQLRSELKTRIDQAYLNHLGVIEEDLKLNPKKFWLHISSLRSKGGFEPQVSYRGLIYSGREAAGAFASFFSNVFLFDPPLLDFENCNNSDGTCLNDSIDIVGLTLNDVISGIKQLKSNSSIGPDGIPPDFIKIYRDVFSVPLHHIFNVSLTSGIYPSRWKLSRVTPIPKSSNKAMVEEYRPVAISSSPAKLFESILHKYIYAQVNKYLCDEQHGFRRKKPSLKGTCWFAAIVIDMTFKRFALTLLCLCHSSKLLDAFIMTPRTLLGARFDFNSNLSV